MEINLIKIPFNKIVLNGALTPEYLDHHQIRSNKGIVEKHYKMLTETSYREPLKVTLCEGSYYLLSNYELWVALYRALNGELESEVYCIWFHTETQEDAVSLATRLSIFNQEKKTSTHRLLNIQILKESGKTRKEIRGILEVRGSAESKERQFERDYRIIEHSPMLKRVLGVESNGNSNNIINLLRDGHNPLAQDFNWSQADQIITKLRNDPVLVDAFLAEFDAHKEELRRNHIFKDELTKPISKWKAYDFKRILNLAENIALDTSKLKVPIIDNKTVEDFTYRIVVNNDFALIKAPEITFTTTSKEISDGKKMVEYLYCIEQMHINLLAHLERIRPTHHGLEWKVDDMNSNHLKLDDSKYFEFIRKNKVSKYANKERLLKSINLKTGNLGLHSELSNDMNTYQRARAEFDFWWLNKFKKKEKFNKKKPFTKNPFYRIYILIQAYLIQMTAVPNSSSFETDFDQFFEDLFTYVFRKLDEQDNERNNQFKSFKDYERRSISLSNPEVRKRLEKEGSTIFTEEQLNSFINQHESALTEKISDFVTIVHNTKEELSKHTDKKWEGMFEKVTQEAFPGEFYGE